MSERVPEFVIILIFKLNYDEPEIIINLKRFHL